jgi:hypothetical protein
MSMNTTINTALSQMISVSATIRKLDRMLTTRLATQASAGLDCLRSLRSLRQANSSYGVIPNPKP